MENMKDIFKELEKERETAKIKYIPITDMTPQQLEFLKQCRTGNNKVVYLNIIELWNKVDGWYPIKMTRLKEWIHILKKNNWKIPKK